MYTRETQRKPSKGRHRYTVRIIQIKNKKETKKTSMTCRQERPTHGSHSWTHQSTQSPGPRRRSTQPPCPPSPMCPTRTVSAGRGRPLVVSQRTPGPDPAARQYAPSASCITEARSKRARAQQRMPQGQRGLHREGVVRCSYQQPVDSYATSHPPTQAHTDTHRPTHIHTRAVPRAHLWVSHRLI
jgi:hypothetical protein